MVANFWIYLYQFSPQLNSLPLKLRTVKFIYFFYSTYRNFRCNLALYDVYLYRVFNIFEYNFSSLCRCAPWAFCVLVLVSALAWEAPTGVYWNKKFKNKAAYYKTEVLEKVVAPALRDPYRKDHYVFQQDGAPVHTANIVQAWCRENFTDFLDKTIIPWTFMYGRTCWSSRANIKWALWTNLRSSFSRFGTRCRWTRCVPRVNFLRNVSCLSYSTKGRCSQLICRKGSR